MWNRERSSLAGLELVRSRNETCSDRTESRVEGRNRDEARVIDWSLSKESWIFSLSVREKGTIEGVSNNARGQPT